MSRCEQPDTSKALHASSNATYDSSRTHGGSLEGLGITCESFPVLITDETTLDATYFNFGWQDQIDEQIVQFQQAYEQQQRQQHSSCQIAGQTINDGARYPVSVEQHGPFAQVGTTCEPHSYDATSTSIPHLFVPAAANLGSSFPSLYDVSHISGSKSITDDNLGSSYDQQSHHDLQQCISPYLAPTFPVPGTLSSVGNMQYNCLNSSSMPQLHPSAEIHEEYSRRLSVSSNAPSSVFSEQQSTPYFLTPSTTPRFASATQQNFPSTMLSSLPSPDCVSRSRSSSSASLVAPRSNLRPLRPAPYTLDAAQRQRWSTGKTLSLPSRRMQPPELSPDQRHTRAVSQQEIGNTYFEDDFANGDRHSFDGNLQAVRQGFILPVPSIEGIEEQMSATETPAQSTTSQRPALALLQPKPRAPASPTSPSQLPPLNLHGRTSRPSSPPPQDLCPMDGTPPTQNPISPYDAYTPKYKRGTKGQLEGFCGLCKPGRWHNMKNSAYWYDKNYNHGINPKTRRSFDLPLDRRWKAGSTQIREGFCGLCRQWIEMDSCKMSWGRWWKHAYKCQNKIHPLKYEQDLIGGAEPFPPQTPFPTENLDDAQFHHPQYSGHEQQAWLYPSADQQPTLLSPFVQ